MTPYKNCEFVMSGKVQKGDYVCNMNCDWVIAIGLVGADICEGIVLDYYPGRWRACRPITKKNKSIPVIKGVLARAGLSVHPYRPYRQSMDINRQSRA